MFLSFLVVVTLMTGGERCLGQRYGSGRMERCFECISIGRPCHRVEGLFVPCSTACAMIKEGDRITKKCETQSVKWRDDDGNPKCIKNKECYCIGDDNCNVGEDFGLETGSVGTKVISPALCVLSIMVATWAYYIS